jgi:hypothetical protein
LGQIGMRRLLRGIIYLAVLGALGLVAYAYLGDLSPQQNEVSLPVVLNAN